MKFLPQNNIGWLRLAVLPFQAFVALGWFAAQIYNQLDVYGRRPDSSFEALMVEGYMFCFFCLLAGGCLQRQCGDRTGGTVSLIAAAVAALACWVMLPELARP